MMAKTSTTPVNGGNRIRMFEGRLELTWTNKGLRLLAHDDGSYEWVKPSDYRVAEVRLLRDSEMVGHVNANKRRATDNLLIHGDALNALMALAALPEFASEYLGKVRLAYLDPPFNTQQSFLQYDDALEHSVWLTMMRDRLLQIRDLLAPNGSVWVHLDDSEAAYCRVMLDEIFGRDNFVSTVIWEKTDSPRMDAAYFSGRHDYILVYRKSSEFTLHRLPATDPGVHYRFKDAEGQRYYLNPLRARGGQGSTREARPNLYFPLRSPDGTEVYPKLPNGADGAWRWSRERVERDRHLLDWVKGRNGWTPYYRIYEPAQRFRPPETIWSHTEAGSTRNSAAEVKAALDGMSFATPKPERLLQRILAIGSDPGDIVLDCFLGSGTTAAVAQKMGRRWVGVERDDHILNDYALPRLTKVVEGIDPGGISSAVGWQGGGGFRVVRVAPSMFLAHDGLVLLADWATNGALAEATAAQLGYQYQMDPPFCGRKGLTRLAVVDGLVDEGAIRLLLSALGADERLQVCGTAVDPDARSVLRRLRPGSSMRKIPASILAGYRTNLTLWDMPQKETPDVDAR